MSSDAVVRSWLQLLRLAPEPTDVELEVVDAERLVDLARHELILPWYWHRLRTAGLLGQMSAAHQQEVRGHGIAVTAHRMRIEAGTADVVRLLADHGIRTALLKGVAYTAVSEPNAFLAYRQTGDADVLVEPPRAEEAWRLLQANGFRRITDKPSLHHDHHHLPGLVGPSGFTVEIHTSATIFLTTDVSWERFGENAQVMSWRGVDVRVPSNTDLLWHSIVHSLGDGSGGCRLRHLLTSAALMVADIDWDVIEHRLLRDRPRHHDSRRPIPARGVRRWLNAAAWLADVKLPDGLKAHIDNERAISKLLFAQWQCLEVFRTRPERAKRYERYGEEASVAAFSLGVQDGGHWQSWHQRRKRYVSSALYQAMYQLSLPVWRGGT